MYELRSTTFTHAGATWRVDEQTVGDGIDAEMLSSLLMPLVPADTLAVKVYRFADVLTSTALIDGTPVWTPPSRDADGTALLASYEAHQKLPRSWGRAWLEAYDATNGAVKAETS